ncbi:MAG TPA: hypothetical protein VK203_24325 [Nostocaceae cyanobacterium]|nr:hypothetical protein [Nostocaceae cyanobacterium]
MKRIMQAMLAVALVLVTAFTFYLDTASAQPVFAQALASCPGYDCNAPIKCNIPAKESCTIENKGQVVNITIKNTSSAMASLAIVAGGASPQRITIREYGTYQSRIYPNGGDIRIYNDSSTNCLIEVTLQVLYSAPVE